MTKAELLKEIENPKNYQDYLKDKCVSCEKPIEATWEYYKVHGNFCGNCCVIAQRNVGKFRKQRKEFIKILENK